MRVLLVILLLLAGAGDVVAQNRPGGGPLPPVPPRGQPPVVVRPTPTPPVFTNIVAACARPGDTLQIEGRNFNALGGLSPALEVGGRPLALQVMTRTDRRLTVRLPSEGVQPNRRYNVVLVERTGGRRVDRTPLGVRFCPDEPVDPTPAEGDREILIMAEQALEADILAELQARGAAVLRNNDLASFGEVLIVAASADPQTLIDNLRNLFPQADVDFNDDLNAAQTPRLYARDVVKWPAGSGCTALAANVPIGLLDGEIVASHAAFIGRSFVSKNFLEGRTADRQHATAIASILVGTNPDQGYGGLLHSAPVFSAVVLRRTPDDQLLASAEATLRGLDWLLSEDVRLINVSLATPVANRVLIRGFDISLTHGALVFAAAGNAGPEAPPSYPAKIDGVFAITATDVRSRVFNNANQGDFIDFAAPGVDIWTASPDGSGSYRTGTSYAVPYAVGIAALYLGLNSNLSASVLSRSFAANVADLGPNGADSVFGAGLLQAFTCPG